MLNPAAIRLALAPTVAVLLAGCGISDPYARPQRATSTADAAIERGEHDGPAPPPAPPPEGAAMATTPEQALARYGVVYINWTAATLPADERRLAAISTGQARAQALAESNAPPATLIRYAVANAGAVVAIAPGQGTERGKWAIVTDEQTSGDGPYEGLPATTHVTWATVTHLVGEWIVSGWYPGS